MSGQGFVKQWVIRPVAGLVLAMGLGCAGAATLGVSPLGADSGNCQGAACLTIGYALSQAALSGDTIALAAGTYAEQITVNKSVTINGAGMDQSIIQPSSLATNASVPGGSAGQKTAIVFVTGSSTVATLSNLGVRGPGATSCGSIGYGVFVGGDATLTLDSAHIRSIRDEPLGGCQNGNGVGFGSSTSPVHVGKGQVLNSVIDDFQKNGIDVRGAGSSVTIRGNTVTGVATDKIAQNGIIVLDGANAIVDGNTISGMQCNVASCLAGTWGSIGLAIQYPASGLQVTGNTINGADFNAVIVGEAPAPTITMTGNTLSQARYANLQVWGPMALNMVNNTLSGSVDGIEAYEYVGAPVITLNGGNTITGASGTGIVVDGATVQGSKNRFFANGVGADNTTGGGTSNLTCNWWGNFTGPQASSNPGGTGNAASADVTFTNWYVDSNFTYGCVGNPDWVKQNPNGPTPAPVPVDAPWALAGIALALAGLAGRKLRRRR